MRMEARLEQIKSSMIAVLPKRNLEEVKAQPARSNSNRISRGTPANVVQQCDLSSLTSTALGLTQVKKFLTACGLERYYEELTNNGIDDMEILMELSDSHLNGLNIPLGHRIKLIKRISEAKEAGPRICSPLRAANAMEIEINDKFPHSDIFKQSIDQFRKGGSTSQRITVIEGLANSSSDKRIGHRDTRIRVTSTITTKMLVEGNLSCWQCYTLHSKAEGLKYEGKDFCSQACSDLYAGSQLQVCRCRKKFAKSSGVLRLGSRFCSQECAGRMEGDGPVDAFTGW